ncbi:MAG TPA: hypothetical protein VKG44_08275, partial [Candidatus Baltobacteraceae bacterium]|nr:hypothetical protein [Candidatus Baltobacteraceae bacterium]
MTARANVIILVTALVLPLALIALIATYGVNVPFWDDWRWAALILKSEAGRLAFADLWRSNGEHRNLVPSLLALGLARFGGYDTVRESFFSVACVTATLVFALVLLRRTLPAQLVAPLFVPIALLLFSLAQAQNWLWGFQVSWFVANLALFAQVTALGSRRLGIPELSLGAAAALIAVFSCAFGLSTLATGALLLGVRRPLPRRALALWIAGSVLVALVYAQGLPLAQPQYHALHDAGVWQRLGFLLVFEGAPLAGWLGNLWSGVLGLFA